MPPERPKGQRRPIRPVAIMAAMLVIAATSLVAYGIFAGGHSTYMNQPDPDDFCDRCHPEIATALMAGEHGPANCICHGYNPNSSMSGTDLDINMKHNLSKTIYCTSCHSEYDDVTGEIDIGSGASGLDQSAHYIINTSKKAMLYNHSAQQFK
jgi:nitrate/TMAO reductase-like tetraheme cytochrome c subunit